jgi:8-oxo-dGTP diphosphatase
MSTEHNPGGATPPHSPTDRTGAPAGIEIIARGLLVAGGRVLLCRNVAHGYRYLPGGHVEPGESGGTALAREFLEESGVGVVVGPLLLTSEHAFVQNDRARHEINLLFHVEPPTSLPDPWPTLETDIAFDWIPLDRLGEADLRPRAVSDWLVRAKGGKPGEVGAAWNPGEPCGWLSDGFR